MIGSRPFYHGARPLSVFRQAARYGRSDFDPSGPAAMSDIGSGFTLNHASRNYYELRSRKLVPSPYFEGRVPSSAQKQQGTPGSQLTKIDWSKYDPLNIAKCTYTEHPTTKSRSAEDIDEYMLKHEMTVIDHGGSPTNGKGEEQSFCNLPRPVLTFEELCFPSKLMSELLKRGSFVEPTPIQAVGWPIAMSGRDLVGIAQTGSGKTLSFLIPAFMHIYAQQRDGNSGVGGVVGSSCSCMPRVLILAPTRELAIQIHAEAARQNCGITASVVYGGASRQSQIRTLHTGKPELLVATPGRLLDFLEMGVCDLKQTTYFVLDEADRMLDMGFEPQVRAIASQMRPERQTLMWSATWPVEIQRLARELCNADPVQLKVGSSVLRANPDIYQQVKIVEEKNKRHMFMEWLKQTRHASQIGKDDNISSEQKKILIFCKTKRDCSDICRHIRYQQIPAVAIHGDKTQQERSSILSDFTNSKVNIMVATDVAARGLDVPDIAIVVNYDLPQTIEDYVHRIGRTGRAGKKGNAVSFISSDVKTKESIRLWKGILHLMKDVGQQPDNDFARLVRTLH